MTSTSFDDLGEVGRARRLRPLALTALDAWDVGLRRMRVHVNGYNAIFRVDTAEGAFALRVSLPLRTDAQLRAELDWLASLRGVVAVPEPIPTRTGELWAVAGAPRVPGTRRCTLFRWLAGRPLRADDDPALFGSMGAQAAALHVQAADWRRPRGLLVWDRLFPRPDEPPILFDQPLPPSQRTVWRDVAAAGEEGLRMLAASGERPRICHGDLHPTNVQVHRGRTAILDFDDCVLAHPVQDLGLAWFQCRMRGVPAASLRAFRDGYERVHAWPDDGLHARFVAAAALELANGVYRDFDPVYRAAAPRYAAEWARVAREALGRI